MRKSNEEYAIGSAIGCPWCPCGKHKTKEQAVCFDCFSRLPMMIKYGLCSLRVEIREKAVAYAVRKAAERGDGYMESSEGELFR